MGKISRIILCLIIATGSFVCVGQATEKQMDKPVVITHADAAMILAKYSGLFDRYVNKDASLMECVDFFNRQGIYFSMKDVASGKEFTKADGARIMGQIELVFRGNVEYFGGKVKLPKGVDHWEDFCILNDVKFIEGYEAIKDVLSGKRV